MYEFGKFRFDPANHLLLSGGSPVALSPKVFELLLVLVQNGNRLTTKEELLRRVWPNSVVEEANLTVNISALRRILGETADGRPYIETVPKKGYRFVAPVAEVQENTADPVSPGAERVAAPPPRPSTPGDDPASNPPPNSQPVPGKKAWRRFGVGRAFAFACNSRGCREFIRILRPIASKTVFRSAPQPGSAAVPELARGCGK